MYRTQWGLPDLQIPLHSHQHIQNKSIFIIFRCAALCFLVSLSIPHTHTHTRIRTRTKTQSLVGKQKSILLSVRCHHNYSFETAIENKLHLHCVFIRLLWVSNIQQLHRPTQTHRACPPWRSDSCSMVALMSMLFVFLQILKMHFASEDFTVFTPYIRIYPVKSANKRENGGMGLYYLF